MDALFATFGLDTKLLVIQAVNFGIVLVVLWWFLFRPLMKVLAERQQKIKEGVKAAERAQVDAAKTEEERSRIVGEANHKAETIVASAEQEGKREREAIVHSANERADQVRKDAELQAAEAMRSALKESEKEIARTAVLAAEKILKKS